MSSKKKTAATKDDCKPALVPKLRFPEFREAEVWSQVKLGAVADIKTGPFGSTLHQSDYVVNGTPIVTVEHLSEGGLVHKNLPMVSDEDKQRLKSYILRAGDIVFSRVGSVDRNSLVRDEEVGWLFSGRLLRIRTNSTDLIPPFLSYYFQLDATKSKLRAVAVGQTMASLNTEILSAFQVLTAQPAEQQKIAECLSSVDELMAAQSRKVDALKTHKKGLMQQLFPREGETQPRLRFPEFQNAGEWVAAPLGQLLVSSPDYGVNAAAVPFSDGLPKYLRITDISEDGTYLSDKMVSVDIEPTDGNYLDEGDIALARTGASVGKSYRYRKEDGRLVFAGFLIRIKPAKKKLVSAYLANFLTTDVYWDWVAATSTRSGQPGINSTEYSSLSIPLPPGDLSEQQRIADCLTSLDDLIAAQTQKLAALKTHKKGLMQQLFPSSEEIES